MNFPRNLGESAHSVVEMRWLALAGLWAAHGLLGLLMHRSAAFASLHAIGTLLGALAITLFGPRSYYVILAGAYVAGAEVLWRMSGAWMFHEVGKYAVTVICVIALLRMRRPRLPGRVLLYFGLLLPSVVITYYSLSFDSFRKAVSFNLSGALALTAAVCLCRNVQITSEQLRGVFLTLATPIVGVAAITVFSTYTRDAIRFTNESNFETSGGFGPNQVASVLGLGALLALLYLVQASAGALRRVLLFGTFLIFAMQSAMTFSRGGLYIALGAFLVSTVFLVRDRRGRARLAGLALAAIALSAVVIVPALSAFTGGKLISRFTEPQVAHRGELMMQDVEMWLAHPLYGVGVGISKYGHTGLMAAHTEFSRVLAEHGVLGIAALVVLLAAALHCVVRVRVPMEKAFATAMLVWSFLYMSVNALRLAAPGFAFGLAFLSICSSQRGVRHSLRYGSPPR